MAILENYSGIGEKSDKQPSNSERRHVFSQALQPVLMNGKTNYQKNNSIVSRCYQQARVHIYRADYLADFAEKVDDSLPQPGGRIVRKMNSL
jgi:hypothetical protein